ncbi:hypothetical protein FF2_036951 [Malus domestica]
MLKITPLALLIVLTLPTPLLCFSNVKRHVVITNNLGPGIVLTVKCKSKNDDLGRHEIPFQHSFSWKFKTNSISTLFFCHMRWNKVSGSFEVYKASRDDKRCANCLWRINQQAAFTYDEVNGKWDMGHVWQK